MTNMQIKKVVLAKVKSNKFLLREIYLLSFIFLFVETQAQHSDTMKNWKQDEEMLNWFENYIVKNGYFYKSNPFRVDTTLTHEELKGRYSIEIIEQQSEDFVTVILYYVHAGSTQNEPEILKRTILNHKKSEFQVLGRNNIMGGLDQLYQLFYLYKFSKETQLYCYNILISAHLIYTNGGQE
jgi:hypothetical protein